jgi:hypothetical protein
MNSFNRPAGTGYFTHDSRPFVPCPKASAPKGLEDSAQGFNRRPERIALKGRQIERTNNAKVGPIVARLNCGLQFLAQQ